MTYNKEDMKKGSDSMQQNRIELDYNNMMSETLGFSYGIPQALIETYAPAAQKALESVQHRRGTGWLGWTELPYNQAEIVQKIKTLAGQIRSQYEAFVIFGIGGSALGPIAVQQALNHLHYNQLPRDRRTGPKLYVEDNIDPERMAALMDVIDLAKTCFCVITKSGATAETMSQYLIITDLLKKKVGSGYQKQIIAITDEQKGNLVQIARQEGFETLVIPDGVGGRFSELCPVGLLPAAVCGIDIDALLEGARDMDQRCKNTDLWQNPALMEAVLSVIAMQELDKNIQVVLPYSDALKTMSDWFCQLWAESLGKNVTRKGMAVNLGQTPTKALGVTDQHSQLQLYTEGPYDKMITFLKVGTFRAQVLIPQGAEGYEDVAFLGGKTQNALIEAERQGTEYALCKAGRMNQTITLPQIDAHTVGQLLYFFEMTTAYAGELLDIDAFNQPGVEESKIASYAVLGNKGAKYQAKRAEMGEWAAANPKYTIV